MCHAVHQCRLYQLTWQNPAMWRYQRENISEGAYSTPVALPEGWGLTNNGSHLVASDGSATLYFMDPDTLEVVQTVQVGRCNAPDLLIVRQLPDVYALCWMFCQLWWCLTWNFGRPCMLHSYLVRHGHEIQQHCVRAEGAAWRSLYRSLWPFPQWEYKAPGW